MNKKRFTLLVVAAVMVCLIAVAGTLAYLNATTLNPVTNTFVASDGLIDPPEDPDDTPDDPYDNNGIFVLENEVEEQEDGSYDYAEEPKEALGNDYTVLPGVDLPKNPFVRINGKTEVPAYLYVEVVDTLGEDSGLSYEITDAWTLLEGVTGANDGKVYVYTVETAAKIVKEDVVDVHILVDDTVTVSETLNIPDDAKLEFYAYLAQASAGADATEAFTNCFAD